MERQEAEQSILGTTELSGLGKEPQRSFVDPSPFVGPTPAQPGQSSLPELGPELVPVDASHLLTDSTLFTNSPFTPQFSATEPYEVAPGIDSLTGLALNESPVLSDLTIGNSDKPEDSVLLSAEAASKEALHTFFKQPDWQQTFQDIFGNDFNQDRAQGLATAFAQGDFSDIPPIEILPASVLNGARGGFDTAAGKIYLSDALLSGTPGNTNLVKSVLIEEIGHFIDAQINQTDTPGDEGEYFADRVQGVALSNAELLSVKAEDDHATIWLSGSQHLIEESSALPNFAIRTEGSLRMNGGGDLDGDPLNLQDDALVYAAKGFTINGKATLPVQYNANGTVLKDSAGKAILVPNALSVSPGYTDSKGPSKDYAGVNPPTVISPQTVDIPSYTSLLNQTLSSRVPSGTPEVTFNAQTPLNTLADWNSKFPSGGTTTNPKVVRVINGGLNIPSNAVLSNTVIKVDSGDINFNGSGQNFTNVVLIATNGNVNLNNTTATDLSVFASGSINANGSAKLGGSSLLATGTCGGSVTFNGSTKTVTGTDQLQVIAQGDITYNGSSNTRGSFLSAGTFTYNGSSTLYGSIGAKCDITFNGNTTVIWASIRPFNQAPTDLGLSPASIAENVLATSVVGTLNTTDPNPGNTFTYSLVSGTGSTDNAAFTIAGNQLKINASPDFEAKSSYSIRVRTTDQDGLSYEKALTVSITDVNEAPTSLVLSNNITPENVAAGSAIGTLSTTDPDANNTFTYSLVTGTGSTDNAAFTIVGNQLKINASPNFEAKSSYSILVRTTDQGGLSYDKALVIGITDLNEAPTSLVLSNNVTPENVSAGSVIGTLATADPDANNTFTYSLVSGTGSTDNAAFSIVGNQLKINASPDFESKSSYGVRVRTTDQGGLSYEKTLTIAITDLNEAPTILVLSNSITPENVAAGSVIGTLTSTDPDANNTFTYTLVTGTGATDNAAFSIVNNQLKINASPDFESKSSYSIRVRTTDQGGLSYEQALVIGITDVNEAPTSLVLSNNVTPENVAAGSVIGTLSTTDPDANNTFTYSLVSGAGSTDNASFSIVGNQLKINASPDFEAKSSYNILVRTTDQGGLSYDKALVIGITDVNEAPTSLVLSNSITAENVAAGSAIGTFTSTDPDANNTFTYSLVSGTGSTDNAAFSIVGNQLKINASPDFEAKSSYSILVRTTDQGGLSYDKALVIGITDLNEAPTSLVLSNSITPENVAAGSVIGTLSTTDPDANNTFTYSLVSGTGATDNAAFSIAGNQLKINASPDFETKSSHSIRVRTTDQGGLSYEKAFAIAVTDLNEAPTDLSLSPSSTLENVAPGSVIGNFNTTDPDANNTFSYSLVAGTGSTDNTAFSVVNNQLKINASPDFESKSSYSVRVRTTDQGGLSSEKALTVSVTNVNEAPISIALTNASVPENSGTGTIIGQLSTVDPDQGDTHQYALTDTAGDRFEIIGKTLQVKAGAVLDFESTPSLSIEVKSTDAGGLSTTQRFGITLTNVNEAPTLSPLANRIVDEGSLVSFSAIAADPDQPSQPLTYSLESAPIPGVNLNPTTGLFTWTPTEAQGPGSYSFAIKVSDGALSDTKTFSIQVAEVNSAPVLGAIADQQLLVGNTLTLQTTATDADLPANALTYSLGAGAPAGAAIDPVTGLLSWTPTATGDFQLTVRVSDNGTPQLADAKTIRVRVLSSNHAPTALALSPATIQENVPVNTVVGSLSTTDPDTGNTFTYTLVSGAGDTHNAVFTIEGNQLKIQESPDYERQKTYNVRVRTTDQGGLSTEQPFVVSVGNVNEAPVFTSTLTGTATADVPYEYRITTTDPENDARAIAVGQLPNWMTFHDNGDGTATLRGTPGFADAGLFAIDLKVTESSTVEHLQANQKGFVGVGALLKEQSNFAPERTLALTIPAKSSTLSFKVNPLAFDFTDPKSINDAFEVALVDAQGKSLLPTLGNGRESFFNWTEGLTAATAAGTTYDAATGTVSVNLAGIAPGTAASLVFRLVNDDTDTTTQVRITDFSLVDAPGGTKPPVVKGSGGTSTLTSGVPVEFNHLADVTPSVVPQYQRTTFNDKTKLLYADVALQNNGTYAMDAPLIVAVNHISDPSVQLRNPDGFTPEGLPFYNFSALVADGKLEQGELSNARSLEFYNPNKVQFTYDLVVLAAINQAPVIQTQPKLEVIGGQPYRYDVNATDPEQDSLTYKLVHSPNGMSIDSQTGLISWGTKNGDVGNHNVKVEVSDGRGGVSQQSYTLAVTDAPPNRPPNFTTTPVVDAYINQPYKYDADAVDPDQDPLTYRLISGPQGIQVDLNTGLVTWQPNGLQSGTYDVALEAVDGKGGIAQQNFKIQTHSDPGNFAPIITSTPVVTAYTSKAYSYDVIAVDPDKDPLAYALVNAPTGMTIDSASGKILWGLPIDGQSDVTVRVQDNRGGIDTQHFTLNVNNTVPAQVTGQVSLSDYQPTSQVVYYQNFEDTSNPLTEWSHPLKNITPSGNRHFIGQYGGPVNGIDQGTSLTLNDLPVHDNINLSFKLFVIQSWDGYSPYNYGYIPDEWKLDVDGGQTLLFTSFDNAGRNNQVYPGQITNGVTPTLRNYKEGAAESNTLGYSFYGDAVYDINISFAHSGTSLKLNFAGAGTTNLNDLESWGLDDVKLLAGSSSKGLQGWTTYVDENLNGKRDSGEVSTKTDAQGKYSFTLSPGSHTIAEEVQPGWTQISPTTTTYHVDLASGQSIQNLNFGNTNGRPNGATDNVAPAFISTPTTDAIARQTFRYEASATDLNSDPLRYSLLVNPDGMVLDPETGSLSWRPTDNQIGTQDVVLQVKDPYGGVDVQSFQVKVSPYNTAPIFTTLPGYTTPLTPVAPGQVFQYQPSTQDAENDQVSYRLASAPNGAAIDPNTGLLTWKATSDQIGKNPLFAIVASDGHGGNTTQSFNLKVFDSAEVNALPNISSQPRTQISIGRTYLYQLLATDSNNDPLTYSLESGSPGMFVDGKGTLTWQPTANQIGSHAVTLSVSDGRGGIVKQSFNIEVVNASGLINHVPVITSTPVLTTNLNKLYQYNLNATDTDNDVLFWALDKAPNGMSIDPKQGTLRWTPQSNQLGNNEVVVRVQDAQGGYSTQTFTLRVTGINAPPQVTSTPDTRAAIGQAYQYQVVATDPEQDALTFNLGQKPQGMTINAQTGVLSWIPTNPGSYQVEVQVIDTDGAVGTQVYTLNVGTTPINHAPEIASTPGLLADINSGYRYQLKATDRDNDLLTYQLISGPQGMTIDPLTGLTQWQNPVTGNYQVVVGALDNHGLGAAQSFTLTAKANGLPTIQSAPSITATPGVEYKYDLQAKDPEGDTLTYTLDSASQGLGMTLDNLGRLRWTPTAAQLGTRSVTLTVTDSAGAKITQQFNLAVTADTEAPKVNLIRSTNIADQGEEVFFQVQATDNIGIKNLQLSINNIPVAIDGNGVARLTNVQPGTLTAKAIATDQAGNQTETTTTIQVLDPTDTDAPQIDLDLSGIANDTITGPVQIKGSISDTNLDYYVLEVAPLDGSAPFKEVFRGTSNVTNGTLGTFDPSLLLNDSYILRLSAFDTNGQGTTTEQTLSVAGELKLGNFRLSFTDLSIPVTGIPINLTRTYDSLTSNNTDDFGFGWRMEFRDTDLRTNLGKDEQYETFGIRSKGFKEGTRVYITLPGGKREGFTFKPTINRLSGYLGYAGSQGGVSGFDTNLYNPAFKADAGVTSTLSVRNPESSGNMLSRNLDTGIFSNLGGQFYNPGDAYFGGAYILTTKEGIEYEIDGTTGDLLKVTDTDGNTLTFTDFDVTSSTGQKIVFERDAQNRITSVTDPMGQKVKYAYNDKGDLTAVTDREGNTTQFEYSPTQAHYLDKIVDPLGRTGIKNEYDASGRLKRILDSNGNPVEMIYDPNNSIQKVKDALGNETVYEYDTQGNVVTEIDAEGKITKRAYDGNNNVLKETIITTESGAQGWSITYTYDSNSNQLSRTNALGETDYYTYDSRGNLLSSVNPLGNTTLYTYDKRNHLTSKTDATGYVTTYQYDPWGNLRTRNEGSNDVTVYDYDNQGNKTKETDALGNVTTYEYDANGNAIKETKTLTTAAGVRTLTITKTYTASGKVKTAVDAGGNLTQYDYDANGNQTLMIDPLGRRTEMKYNDKNQLVETILPDSTPNDPSDNPRLRYSYDANGNKLSIADQDGDATRYSYNSQKLPTGMVLPDDTPNNTLDNVQINVAYTQAGWLKTLVKNGVRTEFEHDAVGRIILTRVIKDGQALETRTTYDAAGNKISETDSLNHATRYTYDAVDRLTSTTYADGTSSSTVYNGQGKATAITDQAGHTTKYEYDVLDRLTAVVDVTNQRTEYKYDEMDHLIEQKDANGRITRYEYDGLGRPTATIRPMGQRSETVYDSVGRVAKTTDFNGEVITYGYDLQNRLIGKTFVSEGRTVAFSYTNDGHRETVTDSRGVTRYEYDTQGQLLSRTEPDNTKISYTYDTQNQRVKTVTSPSGTTSYEYNALAQLTKVTGPDGKATTYTYDAAGNLSTTVRPNGTTQLYRYDALNRPIYLENKDQNGQILSSYAYTYDKVGNKLSVEEFGGRKVNYTYDTLNRLTKEAITDPVNRNRTIEYTYDVVGNRLSRNDSVEGLTTYTYDGNDRLLTETKAGVTTTYAYDRNGNLVSEQTPSKTVVYDWDSENHLMGAITSDATGTHQVQYLYDENGIRVASIRDSVEVRYLVDENRQYAQVIEEYSSTTGTIASYVYGNELVSQSRGSTTSYYLNDGHSGVRLLTDAAGVVTDSYTYDAYGEVIQKKGNTTNDYLYRGEQTDPNTGLQYLRARYYDTNTGRFASTDPFPGLNESPLSKHRYLYANDNPITYSDPSGLFSMGEITAADIALNTLIGGVIQSFVGYSLSKISGEPVQWNGYSLSAAKDEKGVSYGGFFFDLTSEKVDGSKARGFWLVLALGTSFPILPKSFSSDYSGSIGLPDLFGNPPTTVLSPRYFGTKFAAAALSGYFNYLGLDSIPGIGIGIGGFTMGFGVGNISWSLGAGFSAGLNTQTGISIPLLPFFDDIK